jgi:hypothetical protein
MSKTAHFFYIALFVAVTSFAFIALAFNGFSYYRLNQEERFYHSAYGSLKPSGPVGHGLGITGSLCILTGVGTYMVRKRYRSLSRFGLLKYWLEFHIFMCVLGTILIVFHTTFKAQGVAAVSFWSMATVFISGIAGRVIYLQIPRTQEGRELDLKEVREMRSGIVEKIRESYNLDEESLNFINYSIGNQSNIYKTSGSKSSIRRYFDDRSSVQAVKKLLSEHRLTETENASVVTLVREDIRLGRRIERLETMKNLFNYWHIFHLPFAVLMLIFMVVHVIVTVVLGYRWIL